MERLGALRGSLAALVALVISSGALAPGPARAHIVYGQPSLHLLVVGADLVARVRIAAVDGAVVLKDSGTRRPITVAKTLEVLKGSAPEGPLRFAQHGHGVVTYTKGEEVIVFLASLERSRELDALRAAGLRYVSFQEHDASYVLEPGTRDVLLSATRGYVDAGRRETPADRVDALRAVTLELLVSGDARLATSAIRDLALADATPLVLPADAPLLLERVVKAPNAAIGVRVGLLVELDRRGMVDGPAQWLRLIQSARPADRPTAVRAAGRHPSPPITAALIDRLGDDDPQTAAAAALALGSPAHAAAVASLARSLVEGDERLRMAAIRGLGGIATPAARRALEDTAGSHPDPATRRRAGAEASRLARR